MTSSDAHLAKLARSGGLSLLGAVFSAVAGVLLVAVITRGLPPDEAGGVFATTSLFLIATALVQLGTEVGLVRWLPAQLATGRRMDVAPTLRVAVLPVAAASTVVAVLVVVAAEPLARLIAAEDVDAAHVATQFRLLAAFLPVAALYNVVLAATRGFRSMRPTVVVESLGRHAAQLGSVALVQVLGLGSVAVVLAWAGPYVAALAAALVWLVILLRRSGPTAEARDPSGERLFASFWRFTAPRAVATVSQVVLKRSDIVLVAALRSPAEAALYTAATRFVVFGQLGVQALQQSLSPHLSALFARDERDAAQRAYQASTAWAMMVAWPIYLASAVLAPELLGLFGAGYASASQVVVVLSLAMLVATASGSVDTVLLMSGRSWLSLVNNAAAVVVNVGLNLLLIPAHGILGAAASWAAAIGVRNALPLVQIRRSMAMSPVGRGSIWVAGSALLCFAVVPGALAVVGQPVSQVVTALVVGLLGYAALLWRGRQYVDLRAFRGLLRRRRGGRNAQIGDGVLVPDATPQH